VTKRNGAVSIYSTAPFLAYPYTRFSVKLNDEKRHATGEPTSLTDSDGSVDIPLTPLKDISTGVAARRSGTGVTIGGVAPDGVGKSAASRFPALWGRRARKAQKTIQAQSTPRSVQDKIICVGGMAEDIMSTTSF
jgi:hypothetical protein